MLFLQHKHANKMVRSQKLIEALCINNKHVDWMLKSNNFSIAQHISEKMHDEIKALYQTE